MHNVFYLHDFFETWVYNRYNRERDILIYSNSIFPKTYHKYKDKSEKLSNGYLTYSHRGTGFSAHRESWLYSLEGPTTFLVAYPRLQVSDQNESQ